MENNEILSTDAELEAKADSVSAKKEEDPKETEKKMSFIVQLRKKYKLDGREIDSIDLAGLEKLTTLDMQELDKVMDRMNWHPNNKFRDTVYLKHVAMRVTGLPVEFFNMMSAKDMINVMSRETIYFLFE